MNQSNAHHHHHGFPLSYAQNQINQHNQFRAEFDNIRQTAAQVEQHVVRVVKEQQMNSGVTPGGHPAHEHNPNAHVHFPAHQAAVVDDESDEEGARRNNNDREDFDDEEGGVQGEEEPNEEDDLNKRD